MVLLVDGLKLLIIGMGMVTFFLCVMIGFIVLSAKLATKFQHLLPEVVVEAKPATPSGTLPASSALAADNGALIAVITAAIQMHRQRRS